MRAENSTSFGIHRVFKADDCVAGADRNPETCGLRCPCCGSEWQHVETPREICSDDSYRAGWGGRGDLLIIPISGECGSAYELCFGFHKGETSVFVRIVRSCEDEGDEWDAADLRSTDLLT